MNEQSKLRLSLARIAQLLDIQSPLVSDPAGKPLTCEALHEAADTERGWNALVAQCGEGVERLQTSVRDAQQATTDLAIAVKDSKGFLEAWALHLADSGRDEAAAEVNACLRRLRELTRSY